MNYSYIASVIIITKNQKRLLKKSLPILLNQSLKQKYEIIVVDSGSSDGTQKYVSSLPITLIEIGHKSFNYAHAFNIGASRAQGKYLIRISGDCMPIEKDCLKELLDPFKDRKVGATYGKYITTGKSGYKHPSFWPEERFPSELTRYTIKPTFFMGIVNTNKKKEYIFSLAGGLCAIRRKLWEKRPFNHRLPEAEDAEYAWFLHLVGYDIVYTPYAKAVHEHKIVTSKIKKQIHWRTSFTIELVRYWLLRSIGINPYKELHTS